MSNWQLTRWQDSGATALIISGNQHSIIDLSAAFVLHNLTADRFSCNKYVKVINVDQHNLNKSNFKFGLWIYIQI